MEQNNALALATELLQSAGIEINGNNPWDIQVYEQSVFARIKKEYKCAYSEFIAAPAIKS